MDYSDKIARYQEIERRGLLNQLPIEKQEAWAEYKRRQTPELTLTDEQKAKIQATKDEYARRQAERDSDQWFVSLVENKQDDPLKNFARSTARLGLSGMQGVANAGFNPFSDTAKAMGADLKPIKPENYAERMAELGGEAGYDAAALYTVGKLAGEAGLLGQGISNTSKIARAVFSPEGGLNKFVAPAVGGAFVRGYTNPTNAFEQAVADLTGAMTVGGIQGALEKNITNIAGGLKNILKDDNANAIVSKGIKGSKEVAQQVTDNAPRAYNQINSEMENALEKATGRQLNVGRALENQQERMNNFIGRNADYPVYSEYGVPTETQLNAYQAESTYNPNIKYTRADAAAALEKRADNMGVKLHNNIDEVKEAQLKLINNSNPMYDDYHTGIRKIDDIKTWEEAMSDPESFVWGDFTREQAEQALKEGKIKIYSSYPIEDGGFVSTSKNQARDYAGGGKVYEQEVPLQDVAWINGDEGQYAPVKKGLGHFLKKDDRLPYARTLENTVNKPDVKFVQSDGNTIYSKKYDNIAEKPFDYVVYDKTGNPYTKYMTDAEYLSGNIKTADNISISGRVMDSTNGGYVAPYPKPTYNVTSNYVNVNSNVPNLKDFTQGLDEFQMKALNTALEKGKQMSTHEKGSLGATHRAQEVLNDMINASYDTSVIGRKEPTTETRELMKVKERLNQMMESSGIKEYDASLSKAKSLKAFKEMGYKFKPSETKFENLGLEKLRDKKAFLQGYEQQIKDNVLSDGGTNLAAQIKKGENVFEKLLPKKQFDSLMKKAGELDTDFKRLKSLEGQADRELVKQIERNGSSFRENSDGKYSWIGRMADIAEGVLKNKVNVRLARQYLNPETTQIIRMGGLRGFGKGAGSAATRQTIFDLLNRGE